VTAVATTEGEHPGAPAAGRRSYDSTLRRRRAAETRARIIAAGSELLHGSSVRDWHGLTIRAVAERAGVNERTVYRHFSNEQGLHDAVMQQFEDEAGIDLRGMQLEDVADVTARIFAHVSSYPPDARQPLDPTLLDAKQRQHEALLAAVSTRTGAWSDADRAVAAAVLDVLWSVASYERLVVDWQMDPAEANRGIGWVIGLVHRAIVESPGGLAQFPEGFSEDSSGIPPRSGN
jgi:AcrR family transcriptional regulator